MNAKTSTLAVKLAHDSIFGVEVLNMCTVARGRGSPAKRNNFPVIPRLLEQPGRIWTGLDEVYW